MLLLLVVAGIVPVWLCCVVGGGACGGCYRFPLALFVTVKLLWLVLSQFGCAVLLLVVLVMDDIVPVWLCCAVAAGGACGFPFGFVIWYCYYLL